MTDHDIPLSVPTLNGNERDYINECISTNYVSSVGPFVDRFEREFAAYVAARYAVACASGTAAIHIAMRLLGVEPQDEVMVPSLTFVASANPVRYERGTAVLVDAEPSTWNVDPLRIVDDLNRRARIGMRMPKVIEVVHILGHPAAIEPIVEVCSHYGVTLIEDAAESMGATYLSGGFAGRHVGTIGKLGCFSFNGNKIMTTGGGGMIVTDDEHLARRAKHLTTQARLPGVTYDHDEVGYNYRMTNLAAALGVAQLEQMPKFLAKKRKIADRYDAAFRDLPGVVLPPNAGWAASSRWLYTIGIDPQVSRIDRDTVLEVLAKERIQTRPIWRPLHQMSLYRNAPRLGGETADRLFSIGLSLPCSASLDEGDQQRVIDSLRGLLLSGSRERFHKDG